MARTNPALPAITGPVVRASIWQTNDTNYQIHTLDFMARSAFSMTGLTTNSFAATVLANITVSWPTVNGGLSLLNQVTVQSLSDPTVPTGVATAPPGIVGTATLDNNQLEVAAVITKLTAIRGQHGRGRLYMPAIPTTFNNVDPNFLTAAAVTAYETYLLALVQSVTASAIPFDPCVATRPVAPAVVVSKAAVIVTTRVNALLGAVRRRRVGRGI